MGNATTKDGEFERRPTFNESQDTLVNHGISEFTGASFEGSGMYRGADESEMYVNVQATPQSGEDKMDVDILKEEDTDEDLIPTVFRWEHGGRNVCITGTFNNWDKHIPMHCSGNEFTYIRDLKRGKHMFKFIVDDEWRYAPDLLKVGDKEGRVNNYIDVTNFEPYTGEEDSYLMAMGKTEANEVYGQETPDDDEYTKEPPPLPPHLRHIILNKPSPDASDPKALPTPHHVALNHLYCTAIKDKMMVLGMTQ